MDISSLTAAAEGIGERLAELPDKQTQQMFVLGIMAAILEAGDRANTTPEAMTHRDAPHHLVGRAAHLLRSARSAIYHEWPASQYGADIPGFHRPKTNNELAAARERGEG